MTNLAEFIFLCANNQRQDLVNDANDMTKKMDLAKEFYSKVYGRDVKATYVEVFEIVKRMKNREPADVLFDLTLADAIFREKLGFSPNTKQWLEMYDLILFNRS